MELPHSDKFVVADGAVVFTDKLGRDVSISQKPQRVIILDYNALDLWYHAGGTAVGRTGHILVDSRADEDEMGSEIKNVPIMNEAHDPVNIEMIVAQEPDLIIISPPVKRTLRQWNRSNSITSHILLGIMTILMDSLKILNCLRC